MVLSSILMLFWALAFPLAVGMVLENNATSVVCGTRYASKPRDGPVPSVTIRSIRDHDPLTMYTTSMPTKIVTPKPITARTTELVIDTSWVTVTPTAGVLGSTRVIFDTSTFWHYESTTETHVVEATRTTTSTSWIPAPTGFRPIEDTRSGWKNPNEGQRGHPHQNPNNLHADRRSTQYVKPLASRFPVAIECIEQVDLFTTNTVIKTLDYSSTITLPAKTSWSTTTVSAVVTSTIVVPRLVLDRSSPNVAPAASSSSTRGLENIVTFSMSPITVTSTRTSTKTTTLTSQSYFTQLQTKYAACDASNQLFATNKHKRINGIATNILGQQTEYATDGVKDAYECCVACITSSFHCAFSLFELEWSARGRCILYAATAPGLSTLPNPQLSDLHQSNAQIRLGEQIDHTAVVREEEETRARPLDQQKASGVVNFKPENGEAVYVASNGFYGVLGVADSLFS